MKNISLFLARLLAILCLQLFTCISHALEIPTEKVYPPYPDVWGYDLTDFPAVKEGAASIRAYRMPDGDIWFTVNYLLKQKDPMKGGRGGYKETKYIVLKFFKGEFVELNEEQSKEFSELIRYKEISQLDCRVNFSDGSYLEHYSGSRPKLCYVPEFACDYHVKTDARGDKEKFLLLGASPNITVFEDEALCDVPGAPFFYQRLYLLSNLIDLGDDTFLAYEGYYNLILRFDKNINTKFKPIHPTKTAINGRMILRNFFVEERAVIDRLASIPEEEMPFYQTIHDQLLFYLAEKYKE